MGANSLSSVEIDAVGEILNISLGSSATAASTMLDARVDITTPIVRVLKRDEFNFSNLEPAIGVEITYVDGLTGNNVMLLKRLDVKAIVEMLMGVSYSDDEFELNEMNISAICEVMNQMMGASATALSELLGKPVNISTPKSFEIKSDGDFKDKYFPKENDSMVVVSFKLGIADKLESEFMNLMPIGLAKELVSGFFPGGFDDEEEPEPVPAPAPAPAAQESSSAKMSQDEIEKLMQSMGGMGDSQPAPAPAPAAQESSSAKMSQDEIEKLLQGMSGGQPEPAPQTMPAPQSAPAAQPYVQQPMTAQTPVMPQGMPVMQTVPVMQDPSVMMQTNAMMASQLQAFQSMQKMQQELIEQMKKLEEMRAERMKPRQLNVHPPVQPTLHDRSDLGDDENNLDLIMGVPVEVSVEIGRTKKLVKDILELNKGSLVVLDKLAGEQVDLYVNGQCIAKGDVVVVDDNFGIRITQILNEEITVA